MSFIAVTHSYRPQLCTHTHTSELFSLHRISSEGSQWELSLASTSAGDPPEVVCPAQQEWLWCPVPPPSACTAAQQLHGCCTCWCRPAVQAHCEEFGWLFFKVLDNRLGYYTSPATVSRISCCCKFGPGDSWAMQIYTKLDLGFCPQHVQKKFSCTISNCILLGL